MPAIEDKQSAYLQYNNLPNAKNLQAPKDTRKKVQQTARKCANEFWVELSQKIQLAANTGNIREMYEGIKKAIGPVQRMTSSIKSSTGAADCSQIITNKWKHEWNITHISTLVRTLCLKTQLIL